MSKKAVSTDLFVLSRFRYDFGEKPVSTSDVSGNIRLTEGYEEIKALSQIDLVSPKGC